MSTLKQALWAALLSHGVTVQDLKAVVMNATWDPYLQFQHVKDQTTIKLEPTEHTLQEHCQQNFAKANTDPYEVEDATTTAPPKKKRKQLPLKTKATPGLKPRQPPAYPPPAHLRSGLDVAHLGA